MSHFFLPPPWHHLGGSGDKFSDLERNEGQGTFLCLNVSLLWGSWLPVGLSLGASRLPPTPLPESPVECRDGAVRGQQGTSAGRETGDGGSSSDEREHRDGPARGKWGGGGKKGEGKWGRRQEERESQRRWGGAGGQEWWGLGDGVQSLGLHQLLSGGGSLCTLFFFILSRYSCWDTASTDARISSSSQSFRPKAEGDIC